MDAVIADNYQPTFTGSIPKPKGKHTLNLRGIYRFETELKIIWKKVGKTPFLSSYIRKDLDGIASLSQLTRSLKSKGLIEDLGYFVKRDSRKLWKINPLTIKYLELNMGPVSPDIETACERYNLEMEIEYPLMHTKAYLKTWREQKPEREAIQRENYFKTTLTLYQKIGKNQFLFRDVRDIIFSPINLCILYKWGFITSPTTTSRGAGPLKVWQITNATISELTEKGLI